MPSIDRLSRLPDDIICHVLSFLPTKISLATCILARRWRSLWAHVPNLDFDSENHHSGTSFPSIINRIMMLRKQRSINSFRICYDDFDCGEYELETWISSSIECNVQNLYLDLDLLDRLPQCLFTCKTIVDLSLHCCEGIPSVGVVSLPNLEKLLLCSIAYEADDTLPHLVSGCPVLEELVIERIVDQDLGCCYISSPTIKRLLVSFPFDNSEYYNSYHTVKINAPAHRYLDVYDCSYDQISLSPMPSFIEANIYFDICPLEVDYYFYGCCVLKFIDSICMVKCLKLSGRYEEFPNLGVAGPYVRFDNLIRLELSADWGFIPKFLESADNLEILIIHEVDVNLQNWMEPIEKQRACLLFCLKTITIDQFWCAEQEFNMVRYLLRNAQAFKRMKIYSRRNGISLEAKFDALKRISLFHRGSRECEVAFS